MRRFVEGIDRGQATLSPECLADWIDENNPVRVIDAFVDKLDLSRLGLEGVAPEATGRPSYHPAVLLKLYIYGYLNRVQSSRRRRASLWHAEDENGSDALLDEAPAEGCHRDGTARACLQPQPLMAAIRA
jgi:hypothetical protein